jgi:hypothetical protein
MVGNGSAWVALGVGTNDYVLTADSAQASGVKWAATTTGVTDHGALTGLTDDDHTLYALADGTRGSFASTTHNHDSDYISIVSTPTAGNFPTLTAGGELANSTYGPSSFAAATHYHDSDYISIVGTPTTGNFPTLTAGGELANSAYGPSSFATSGHDHASTYQPLDADLTTLAGLTVAKGAFIVGNGTPAWSVLSVGTNDYMLVADSAQAAGVKWAADIAPENLKVKKLAYYDEVYDNGSSGTSKNIDWTLGNLQKLSVTGNCTLTFTAPTGPCKLTLVVTNTGTYTLALPTHKKPASASAYALTSGASKVDILSFFYDGTSYYLLSAADWA